MSVFWSDSKITGVEQGLDLVEGLVRYILLFDGGVRT